MTELPVGRSLQAAEQQQDEARRLSALRTWDTEDRGFILVVQQELTSSDSGWAFSCSRRCRACSYASHSASISTVMASISSRTRPAHSTQRGWSTWRLKG